MDNCGEKSQTVPTLPPAGCLTGATDEVITGRWCINGTVCMTVMVLLLISVSPSTASICPSSCICASEIISCSQRNLSSPPAPLPHYAALLDLSFNTITRLRSDWTTVRLSRLHTLLLSHNGLFLLFPEAFVQVRRLKHLDLSSNALAHLDEFIFEPLPHLEVLMLYDNQISHIDRVLFSGFLGLKKLYLSQNQVTRFPLDLLKDRSRLDKLRLLDVSFNRIRALPLAELQMLPAWLKDNLYFHGNPLDCSCELYSILTGWQQRELHPVSNFPDSHVCVQHGSAVRGARKNILKLHLQMNCSTVRVQNQEAFLNQILILDCDSRYRNAFKNWTVPPQASYDTVQMLADGRLQVGPLQVENSGEYRCDVEAEGMNETIVVMMRVFNSTHNFGDSLNTAYTTLACCMLTVFLVLIYLYLIPCPCCPGARLTKSTDPDSAHSSSLSITHTLGQQGAPHVSFCEFKEQNGGTKDEGEEEEQDEGWICEQDERKRRGSVSSDTPIVA